MINDKSSWILALVLLGTNENKEEKDYDKSGS